MTNETTASQPKSIGDDAQFPPLPKPVGVYEYADNTQYAKLDNAYSVEQMQAYVLADRAVRAPAVQASAPIQAAPEEVARLRTVQSIGFKLTAALCQIASVRKGGIDYVPREAVMDVVVDWRNKHDEAGKVARLAATIQEPVMVADPAGVELCVVPRTILQATLDKLENDWLQPDGEWCRAEDTLESSISRGDEPVISSLRAILAATVKAVPSEALDAARWQYIKATTTAIRNSETGEREECTPEQFEQSVDRLRAVPLADKTGGGE